MPQASRQGADSDSSKSRSPLGFVGNLAATVVLVLFLLWVYSDRSRQKSLAFTQGHPFLSHLSGLVLSAFVLSFQLRRDRETWAPIRWFWLILSGAGVVLFLGQLVVLVFGR